MSPVKPFKINVSDAELGVLKTKLGQSRYPDELEGVDWSYGTPLAEVQRLAKYWESGFDWRKTESKLNKELPQFTTTVEVPQFGGIELQFVHKKSTVEGAIPLIFVHGWPGTFYEVIKVLPLLLHGDASSPAFHVVAPSLPNFGFSQGVTKKGFGMVEYATAMNELMAKLGYKEYVTQGGDWGGTITRVMGRLFPENVKASHTNFPVCGPPMPWKHPIAFLQALGAVISSSEERRKYGSLKEYMNAGSGYKKVQETRPQTLGYGIADSPIGMLGWIYDCLHKWTDDYRWTDDELLTWMSIYWFSRAGPAASVRIYYEFEHPSPTGLTPEQIYGQYNYGVKLGLAYFPGEVMQMPLSFAHTLGPVVQQNAYEKGGHFATFEVPELISMDLKRMFGKNGGAFGAVPGHSGFASSS